MQKVPIRTARLTDFSDRLFPTNCHLIFKRKEQIRPINMSKAEDQQWSQQQLPSYHDSIKEHGSEDCGRKPGSGP